MTTWLAFDIGTSATKAALVDARGAVLRSVSVEYATPTHSADGGVVEQQALDWWQAACDAAQALDAVPAEAVVITGQMQNLILLDAAGQPVRPVILYSDSRAHAQAADLNAHIGRETLRHLTGNDQEAGGLLAKFRWLIQHEPDTLARAKTLLVGAADVIAYQLTGVAASDTTTASTTGLLDLNTRQWLTLPEVQPYRHLFPRIVFGGAWVGDVTSGAADRTNLRAGVPVYLAPGDAGAATLGAGSGEPGLPYGYIGTSGWVGYTSTQRANPAHGVFTLAHPKQDYFICVAPLLTAGGNLDWLKTIFQAESHEAFIAAACARPPSSLLYLPYLNGERSPFSDPFARGAFIGLSASHTQADLTRAVLEGVAFAYRHALDALIAEPIKGLMLTGGGTSSLAWCQLFADICGLEIAIAGDAANTGIRGAVLAAQVTRGERLSYAPAEFFPITLTLDPDLRLQAHYERQYALFREAYPALKVLFAQMQAGNSGG